jgi:hypothetical protein
MKRAVIISDLHCGHRAGLVPPDWQQNPEKSKYGEIQKIIYDKYLDSVRRFSPVDVLIVNADAIDGKGERSGGTELLVPDRGDQVSMAEVAIKEWGAKKIILTYGTPYHVGEEDDWEAILAKSLGAEIHSHAWPEIDGVVFDVKHKTPSSVIPHGRYTGPSRERLWNLIWAERDLQPKARVFIRSHVHYFSYSGDSRHLVMTTPALELPSTKYGARQCTGTVDVGLVVFDCENGEYEWRADIYDIGFSAQKTIVI